VTGGQDQRSLRHVLAHFQHVLARRDRSQHLDGALVEALRMLDHHHRIRARRQHPSGVDQHRPRRRHRITRLLAHQHLARHAEVRWQRVRRAECVGGAHSESVHRRPAKSGQRLRAMQRLRRHAPQRFVGRHALDARLVRDARPPQSARLVGRLDLEEFRHGLTLPAGTCPLPPLR